MVGAQCLVDEADNSSADSSHETIDGHEVRENLGVVFVPVKVPDNKWVANRDKGIMASEQEGADKEGCRSGYKCPKRETNEESCDKCDKRCLLASLALHEAEHNLPKNISDGCYGNHRRAKHCC